MQSVSNTARAVSQDAGLDPNANAEFRAKLDAAHAKARKVLGDSGPFALAPITSNSAPAPAPISTPRAAAPETVSKPSLAPDYAPSAAVLNDLRQDMIAAQALRPGELPLLSPDACDGARLAFYDSLVQSTGARMVEAILADLKRTRSGERLHFAALAPEGGASFFTTGDLTNPKDESIARDFLMKHWGVRNLYVGLNEVRADILRHARPVSGDIGASQWALMDVDGRANETEAEFATRTAQLRGWAKAAGAAAAIVRTGSRGLQIWFRMEKLTDANAMTQRAKELNAAFRVVGSDPVNDSPRIARLPGTINLPGKAKRAKGRHLALARIEYENAAPKVWRDVDLLQAVAAEFGKPAAPQTNGKPKAGRANRAPSIALAIALFKCIPNTGHFADRDKWLGLCAELYGATGGAPEAREAWLEWCYGDPVENARVWDTMKDPRRGGDELRQTVRLLNRQGAAQVIFKDAKDQGLSDEEAQREVDAFTRTKSGGYGGGGRKQKMQDDALEILDAANAILWTDDSHAPFISLEDAKGVLSHHSLKEAAGKRQLQGWLAEKGPLLESDSIKALTETLIARASVSGRKGEAAIRFAARADCIYLDKGAGDGRVFKIDPGTHHQIEMKDCPVQFTRPDGTMAMDDPIPDPSGHDFLHLLSEHINLPASADPAKDDAEDEGISARAALLAFVAGAARPASPGMTRPLLALGGAAGVGKTTAAARLGNLLDPNAASVTTAPRDDKHLAVQAKNRGVLVLDNVSALSRDTQDLLCCIATGATYTARALYTDGDLATWQLSRPAILTAITPDAVSRGDLQDRTLTLQLEKHKGAWSESEASAKWTAARAHLLHAMLDMLARGLTLFPMVEKDTPPCPAPRYVDAALFAEACARALGWPDWLLWRALAKIRQAGQDSIVQGSPLAARLASVLKAKGGSWEAQAHEWLDCVSACNFDPLTGWIGVQK